jgi:hypothetical protein
MDDTIAGARAAGTVLNTTVRMVIAQRQDQRTNPGAAS